MKKLPAESESVGGPPTGKAAQATPRRDHAVDNSPAPDVVVSAPRRGDRVTVCVESLAFEGPGVARVEAGADSKGRPRRMVVFIDGVAPGDRVEVEIFSVRHGMARGRVKRFLQYGPARVKPSCPHFGIPADADGIPREFLSGGGFNPEINCGGCSWQFLDYAEQLKVKNELVRDALRRIGGFEPAQLDAVWQPILGAESPWNYRNKMEFSIVTDRDGKRHLGLHMKGRFNDVTEIRECSLFRPWVGKLLVTLRPFLEKVDIGTGDWSDFAGSVGESSSGSHKGRDGSGDGRASLKSLMVRCGTNSGEVMINLLVENADPQLMGSGGWPEELARLVQAFFRGSKLGGDKLVSVYLTLITNRKGQRTTFEEKLLWGKPTFDEQIHLAGATLRFEVAPQAFLQPNTRQAERFYTLVARLADLRGGERVLDLFCGTGTIGIALAANSASGLAGAGAGDGPDAKQLADLTNPEQEIPLTGPAVHAVQVTGLELNAAAVENARRSAALNGIGNIDFVVGDATKLLPDFFAKEKTGLKQSGHPVDLIVVDPPRAGLTAAVIEAICDSPASRLIYVSCNPPTLARDLKLFAARGWRLTFVQPVDQFSHTYHVETVTMLERHVR